MRMKVLARASPLLLVALVAVLDSVIAAGRPPVLLHGLLDEIAHVVTTALLLLAVARGPRARDRTFFLTALAATVLIDADHLPLQVFGDPSLTDGTPRPYVHSVSTVLLLLVLARTLRGDRSRAFLTACAVGVGLHLVRDVGTAPVSLLWPFWWGGVQVPYAVYMLVLITAGVVCTIRGTAAVRAGSAAERGHDPV